MAEEKRDFPAHLRPDAAFLICDRCGRKSWALDQRGQVCGMPQPDGSRCQGIFGDEGKEG